VTTKPQLVFDIDSIRDDPWIFSATQGVHVLSHLDFYAGYVDQDYDLVAVLFTGYSSDSFEFDIAVSPKYQGQHLGAELMDLAIEQYEEMEEVFPDMKFHLDVINPIAEKMLRKRGFRIVVQYVDRTVMTRNPRGAWGEQIEQAEAVLDLEEATGVDLSEATLADGSEERVICASDDPKCDVLGMEAYSMNDDCYSRLYGVHVGDSSEWIPVLAHDGECGGNAYIYSIDFDAWNSQHPEEPFVWIEDPHPANKDYAPESSIVMSRLQMIPAEIIQLVRVIPESEVYDLGDEYVGEFDFDDGPSWDDDDDEEDYE